MQITGGSFNPRSDVRLFVPRAAHIPRYFHLAPNKPIDRRLREIVPIFLPLCVPTS